MYKLYIKHLNPNTKHIEIPEIIKSYKIENISKKKNLLSLQHTIAGELLLIEALHEHGIEYEACDIQISPNGKPYLASNEIYYSLSHSKEYVICAISDKPIGCDIQYMKDTPLAIADTFTSAQEKNYIEEHSSLKALYQIYTAKEAYLKMKGMSLVNIKDFQLSIINSEIQQNTDTYSLVFDENIDNYLIAICKSH